MNCEELEQIEYQVLPQAVQDFFTNLQPSDTKRALYESRQALQANPNICEMVPIMETEGFIIKFGFCRRDANAVLTE